MKQFLGWIVASALFVLPLVGQVSWPTPFPPAGQVGQAYSYAFQASSSQGSLSYSLRSGTLPPGISLSSSGVLSGTPSQAGTFNSVVRAQISASVFAEQNVAVLIVNQPPPLTFFPTSFPSGAVGVAYRAGFGAVGAVGEMQFTVTQGALPPGLQLVRTSGASVDLVGTPSQSGSFSFTINTIDSFGVARPFSFQVVISGSALRILPDALPAGNVGVEYRVQLSAEGGVAPYRFEKAEVNANFLLSASGELRFTPGAEGTLFLRIVVVDSAGARTEKNFSVAIAVGAVRLITQTLENVVTYEYYEFDLQLEGGVPPYQCVVTSGTLPTGLQVLSNCKVLGTPQQEGSFRFNVAVTPARGLRAEGAISLVSRQRPLEITSDDRMEIVSTEPGMIVRSIEARGGRSPYSFRVVDGVPLPGMQVLTNGGVSGVTRGLLGGDITTVEVVDSLGSSARKTIRMVGGSARYLPPGRYIAPIVGEPFQTAWLFFNPEFPAPVTYRVEGPGFPPGLTLEPSGLLRGTPTQAGDFRFPLRTTAADGRSDAGEMRIVVEPSRILLGEFYPSYGIVGRAYSGAIVAHGGTGPYQFAPVGSTFPQGLTLGADGRISGTPTFAGLYRMLIRVTDRLNRSQNLDAVFYVSDTLVNLDTAEDLPDGVVGQEYRNALVASGGSGAYSWEVIGCCVSFGILSNGVLVGTPERAGVHEFVVGVAAASALQRVTYKRFRMNVREGVAIPTVPTEFVLPNGRANEDYSAALALEGNPRVTAVNSVGLPVGLSVASNGVVSGRLSRTGIYSFLVRIEYPGTVPVVFQRPVTVTMVGRGPVLLGDYRLPVAYFTEPYEHVLNLSGGQPPYRLEGLRGFLPRGLELIRDASGQIRLSGRARQAGTYFVAAVVVDQAGAQSQLPIEVTVNEWGDPLRIDLAGVVPGVVGSPYVGSVRVAGGTAPYRIEWEAGTILPGVSLDTNGNLRGTPPQAGSFTYKVRVIDTRAYTAVVTGIATVVAARPVLSLGVPQIGPAVIGTAYRGTIGVSGGKWPYEISVLSGGLPPGLRIQDTGTIEGIALAAGSYPLRVAVRDGDGQSVTRDLTIVVDAPSRLGDATRLSAYEGRVQANTGQPPFALSLAEGVFPPGLRMDSDGRVSGSPTAAGDYLFVVKSVDRLGTSRMQAVSLRVQAGAGLVFQERGLPGGTVGRSYGQTIRVRGGQGPYRFAVRDGQLPKGISLNPQTGLLSGVTTQEGSVAFLLQALDAAGREITALFEIRVAPEGSPLLSALLSSASYEGGGISPGELLTGFGELLGGAELSTLQLDADQRVSTSVGGTRVLANGSPLAMIYSQANQLSLIGPWNRERAEAIWITVERGGRSSAPYRMAAVEAKPGLFTLNAAGTGEAAILNQNGTLNLSSNPAKGGEVIVAYLTGCGSLDSNGPTGSIASGVNRLRLPVTATIGGLPAEVLYAGSAPGLVEGLTQVNLRVPSGLLLGAYAIRVKVGSAESPDEVLVNVN